LNTSLGAADDPTVVGTAVVGTTDVGAADVDGVAVSGVEVSGVEVFGVEVSGETVEGANDGPDVVCSPVAATVVEGSGADVGALDAQAVRPTATRKAVK
jgi:hypothetical protein